MFLEKTRDISRPVSTTNGKNRPVTLLMYNTVAPSVFSCRKLCLSRAVRCFRKRSHACDAWPKRDRSSTALEAPRGPPCNDLSGVTRSSLISTSLICRTLLSVFILQKSKENVKHHSSKFNAFKITSILGVWLEDQAKCCSRRGEFFQWDWRPLRNPVEQCRRPDYRPLQASNQESVPFQRLWRRATSETESHPQRMLKFWNKTSDNQTMTTIIDQQSHDMSNVIRLININDNNFVKTHSELTIERCIVAVGRVGIGRTNRDWWRWTNLFQFQLLRSVKCF